MHVVFRESHGLEEGDAPVDLAQSPADLVALSFSDSDLGAFAAGWRRAQADGAAPPSLRLANLVALRHPLSVDTYVERTLSGAKGVLIRLIGGAPYWPYGLQQVRALAQAKGIALAVLPADGRPDPQLDAASTLPVSTLRRLAALCDEGGAVAAQAALQQLALAAGLYAAPVRGARALPQVGAWLPGEGVICPATALFALGGAAGAQVAAGNGAAGGVAASGPAPSGAGSPSAAPLDSATAGVAPPGDARPGPAPLATKPVAGVAAGDAPLGHALSGYAPPAAGSPSAAPLEGATAGASPLSVAFLGAGSRLVSPSGATLSGGASLAADPSDAAGARGAASGRAFCGPAASTVAPSGRPRVLVVFYRAYLAADDLHPLGALVEALAARGFAPLGLFAPSLKAPQARAWLARWVRALAPAAVVNATAFAAGGEDGAVLEGAGAPVFQIALATSDRAGWLASARGLSPADLAMHVVLPEVDGRLFAGVASFKDFAPRDDDLQFARAGHRAESERIAAIADKVAARVRLGAVAPARRRLAVVLSTYPGKAWQTAHAVGLDALASTTSILQALARAGHAVAAPADLAARLAGETIAWPLDAYRAALARLPQALRDDLAAAWGAPEGDPACRDGAFHFAALAAGSALVALQPERGARRTRADDYHDLSRCPRHGYVAFHLWLRAQGLHALIHVGAHGTLEWLPGKAVALSGACWPEALIGDLPVIYPFIVNDPGEAAQAKRRIGAITLGHLPPPMTDAGGGAGLARLETLLDEFSNADGLDPARRDRLVGDIRAEAEGVGLAAELGLDAAAPSREAVARIDRFVCDVKESRFGVGLHVFGAGPDGAAERAGLLAAVAGRHVAPGPSGSPFRGREDVRPTGRNLFTTDPRAVPSRAAHAQGVRLADELVRRHLQDHGDWPRALVVDLWGSATMRTAGEEFAMALHLLGARPVWDDGGARVSGVEILPIAELDRPRLDVTLRVSGLFRDVFPTLSALFGQAVRALAAREEAPDWNPYAGRDPGARVYGPGPGLYGVALGELAEDYTPQGRAAAGAAWLSASAFALDADAAHDPEGIRARVAAADAFVHVQDLPETDLLLAADYAAHEAGFAAAQAVTGGRAALYHLDATQPGQLRARPLTEEIARVVRARAANPTWVRGMMAHDYRGGAEIAATLDHLARFAHLARAVPPALFDLYHDATLGDADVRAFLAAANPGALAAMEARFASLAAAGLWTTRRNSIAMALEGGA